MMPTQPPQVYATAGLPTTARLMLFWDVDRVEVCDHDGHPLGIVTERDLIRVLARSPKTETISLGDIVAEITLTAA